MKETTKFEFCSKEWVGVADDYLQSSLKGADLTGINYTFGEVFTDAPAHLVVDDQGRTGWYYQIRDGAASAVQGIAADADETITAPYENILPLARLIFEGNEAAVAEAAKAVEQMTADGKLERENNGVTPPEIAPGSELHDVLAKHTL